MTKGTDGGHFQVQMLGGFFITFDGKEIVLGRKSTLKFIRFLQLVWLFGKKGITKEQVMKAIYDGTDISDFNNSINNLIYQLRQQMAKAGLPEGDYIVRENGLYIPEHKFPVRLDVHEFENFVKMAEMSKDEEKAFTYYKAAFDIYKGELLPASNTEIWVIVENTRLKKLFESCVDWLKDYYRKKEDYSSLDALYEKTTHIYPYDEKWQIGQIYILFEKGDYKKAYSNYNDMVYRYSENMGLPPTPEMVKCYEKISRIPHDFPEEMNEIKDKMYKVVMIDEAENRAYYCSYRSFADICHIFSRGMERTGRSRYLMLCSLVDYEGKPIQNMEKRNLKSEVLRNLIGYCLRKGDVYTQYNNCQYLILLDGINRENCEVVYRRIRQRLKEECGSRAELKYSVLSMAEFDKI